MHFKSLLVHDLKTKSDFWSKCPHYIMGYIINVGSMFFLFSLALNLLYIDYSLCHIWSVNMQYLRCCDHSNKCLFLVIQQAEVLLNFLVSVWRNVKSSCQRWISINTQLYAQIPLSHFPCYLTFRCYVDQEKYLLRRNMPKMSPVWASSSLILFVMLHVYV